MWLLLACTAGTPTPPSISGVAGPNLLLVTVDTLRADYLGSYGYSQATSPNIDQLAASGVRFTEAYTPRGLTWPALTSLMTAQYPVTHGIRTNAARMTDAPTTLAERLAGQGYQTTAILTNSSEQYWEGFSKVIPIDKDPRDQTAADQAVAWISGAPEKFFLWLHLVAPHDPWVRYEGTPDFTSMFYRGDMNGSTAAGTRWMLMGGNTADLEQAKALYAGEVGFADAQIGKVIAALKQRGLGESTLVVVTADHGEEMADHPPYLHHQASIWEGVARVPLIISQPGKVGSATIAEPVDLLDVAPTILELLQLPSFSGEGRSLMPLLSGSSLKPKPLVMELENQVIVVRTRQWTYISNPNRYRPPLVSPLELRVARIPATANNQYELPYEALFDRTQDRYEKTDVAAQHPEAVAEMREIVRLFCQQTGWPQGNRAQVDPDLRVKLEQLGYWFAEP